MLPVFYSSATLMVATARQCRCCPGDYFLKPVNWIVPPTLSTSWVFRKNGSSVLGKAGLTKSGLTELRVGESFHDLSKAYGVAVVRKHNGTKYTVHVSASTSLLEL